MIITSSFPCSSRTPTFDLRINPICNTSVAPFSPLISVRRRTREGRGHGQKGDRSGLGASNGHGRRRGQNEQEGVEIKHGLVDANEPHVGQDFQIIGENESIQQEERPHSGRATRPQVPREKIQLRL